MHRHLATVRAATARLRPLLALADRFAPARTHAHAPSLKRTRPAKVSPTWTTAGHRSPAPRSNPPANGRANFSSPRLHAPATPKLLIRQTQRTGRTIPDHARHDPGSPGMTVRPARAPQGHSTHRPGAQHSIHAQSRQVPGSTHAIHTRRHAAANPTAPVPRGATRPRSTAALLTPIPPRSPPAATIAPGRTVPPRRRASEPRPAPIGPRHPTPAMPRRITTPAPAHTLPASGRQPATRSPASAPGTPPDARLGPDTNRPRRHAPSSPNNPARTVPNPFAAAPTLPTVSALPPAAPRSRATRQPTATGDVSAAPPTRQPAPPQPNPAQTASAEGYLDQARLGRWLARTLAADAARPPAAGTAFDPRRTPAWAPSFYAKGT